MDREFAFLLRALETETAFPTERMAGVTGSRLFRFNFPLGDIYCPADLESVRRLLDLARQFDLEGFLTQSTPRHMLAWQVVYWSSTPNPTHISLKQWMEEQTKTPEEV